MNDLIPRYQTGRTIRGMSAILLPMSEGEVDWAGFDRHVERTFDAGLTPAINMDTGYANLIDESLRVAILHRTQSIASGKSYVAGAFVSDRSGDSLKLEQYARQIESIESYGGLPIVFQSFGLTGQTEDEIYATYEQIGARCNSFLAFELGQMFAPFGRIYSLDLFQRLLAIERCVGAKHSSLNRSKEWERQRVVAQHRPDFQLLTGNDLAIDMVFYGSDYLLGLSTFAPDYFALRDRYWRASDRRAIELNDVLQYLGFFAFRDPVPAYKHSAAQFLKLRGWINSADVFPGSPTRPDSDVPVLAGILQQLQQFEL